MIKKVLLLAGILAVFSTTKAHPATDNDTIEVVYADTTGIDIDSIEASIDHIELDEVTVEASAWVRKADRNLLFPNAQQIKQSKNGLQLLQKLQIPGIVINPTDNSISLTDKSELSLRINGRPVTEKEIQGISPEQIIRVEYIDNPGIRYGEAGAVLDFIIKTPTSGGSCRWFPVCPHRAKPKRKRVRGLAQRTHIELQLPRPSKTNVQCLAQSQ